MIVTDDAEIPGKKRVEQTTVSILTPQNMQAIANKILRQQQHLKQATQKKGPSIMNMNLVHTSDIESISQWNNLNVQLQSYTAKNTGQNTQKYSKIQLQQQITENMSLELNQSSTPFTNPSSKNQTSQRPSQVSKVSHASSSSITGMQVPMVNLPHMPQARDEPFYVRTNRNSQAKQKQTMLLQPQSFLSTQQMQIQQPVQKDPNKSVPSRRQNRGYMSSAGYSQSSKRTSSQIAARSYKFEQNNKGIKGKTVTVNRQNIEITDNQLLL